MRMTNSEEVHLRSREKSSGSSGFGASSNGESSSKLNTKDKMKRVPGGGRPRNRKVVIGGLLVLALLAWMFLFNGSSTPMHSVGWLDENVYLRFGLNKEVYAVVLDAGSTGTRVLAFAFHQSVHDNNLKLKDELFHEVKPGLSSYSDDPQAGADSVKQLLSRAKIFIPQEHWAKTPVSLKATAGLRLLPKAKADAILEAVSNVIKSIGFHATEDSVGIMDGVDEGIFSWFTVNFLLDRIGGPVSKTVAALDLGGGSTQITVASSPGTIEFLPSEDIQNISLFHQQVPLYTHSYLGLGLQAVRKAVLSANQTNPESTVLESVCVNPVVSREWTYGGVTYTMKGVQTGKFEKVQYNGFARKEAVADWDECYKVIVKIIEEKGVIKPKDLNRQIVVISYFFERAAEAGLVDPLEGGKLTLQHYLDAGKLACRTVNADLPLACLDLTFMGAILHNGYGLAKSTPLLVLKKLHGHELSWALGAAYHILQNGG
ncbi:ectonucleoside triphosphate diphosphohydrolase 5 isoform X3 [Folsomia candida]|uniref:ectonucleoside triphosphate diphosphohydrolase 5 isoform X3 n=1 Tax=Folsomia candida TaxID=158441 RepID=UPI000B8FE117|nr:ectonucleoside triphosphate diphosphohydrolase 5 isoform X3 [Folsomia candida]